MAELAPPSAVEGAPGHPRARVDPLSAEAFAVQFTRSREADERFRYLQDLLGHQVSRGDIAEVYDRAVRELIKKMERVRFGACMQAKREQAKAATAERRAEREKAKAAAVQRRAEREQRAEESRLLPHELEVIPWLRQLGCRDDESRIAARRCREMAAAPLEDRVKRALSWFGARLARTVKPVAMENSTATPAVP